MSKQIHLGVQVAGGRGGFASVAHIAQTAERGRLDVVLHDGSAATAALAAVTERIGLAGTVDPTCHEPYELARQLATLDHLSGGRAAASIAMSADPAASANFRRAGYLPEQQRYERAAAFMRTVVELLGSWRHDAVVADKASGTFLRHADAGQFVHRDGHFDIAGRFTVPRGFQDRPVIVHTGDTDDDRDFAASGADVLISRHRTASAGRAFCADVTSRLARYGRSRDELLIMPAVRFVITDTDTDTDTGPDADTDTGPDVADIATELHTGGVAEPGALVGSASTVATRIEEFVRTDACDGFVLVTDTPAALDRFVDQVVPLLVARGVFRADYEETTLRERLGTAVATGLERAAS